jgi:hypothetical protein
MRAPSAPACFGKHSRRARRLNVKSLESRILLSTLTWASENAARHWPSLENRRETGRPFTV